MIQIEANVGSRNFMILNEYSNGKTKKKVLEQFTVQINVYFCDLQ